MQKRETQSTVHLAREIDLYHEQIRRTSSPADQLNNSECAEVDLNLNKLLEKTTTITVIRINCKMNMYMYEFLLNDLQTLQPGQ